MWQVCVFVHRSRSQVGLDNPRVGAHLVGRAFSYLFAKVQHRDNIRNAHHHAHIVLNEQNGEAKFIAQPAGKMYHCLGFSWVHTGSWLIKQEQTRTSSKRWRRSVLLVVFSVGFVGRGAHGQGPRYLQPTLVAIGQVAGHGCFFARQPDKGHQLSSLCFGFALLMHKAGGVDDGIEDICMKISVHTENNIFKRSQVFKKADILIGAGDTLSGYLVRAQSADRF